MDSGRHPRHPEGDDHYYVGDYSVEDDPYVQANGVLVNKFGIKTTDELNERETDLASLRHIEALESPIPGNFDFQHLCDIHLQLFQDVYDWAGQPRRIDIGKNATHFLPHEKILPAFHALWRTIPDEAARASLAGDLIAFAELAGRVLGEVNYIHPFREGNGRTQRLYLHYLAWEFGFQIQWQAVSKERMKLACIDWIERQDSRTLARLVQLNAVPLP